MVGSFHRGQKGRLEHVWDGRGVEESWVGLWPEVAESPILSSGRNRLCTLAWIRPCQSTSIGITSEAVLPCACTCMTSGIDVD